MRKVFACLPALAAVVAVLAGSPAVAQQGYKKEYNLSSIIGPPHPWGLGAERFAELVRTRTDGRINIKIYHGASLSGGDGLKELPLTRQGVIDFAFTSSLNIASHVPQFGVFSLPFLFSQPGAIDTVISGPIGDKLFEALRSRGVEPLAWGDNGIRELTNSKHPIRSPDDMKGMKFRTVGSPIVVDVFRALGGNPTQISWADTQTALASGAVDGHENARSMIKMFKFWTLNQRYVSIWGALSDVLVFWVNPAVMKNFSPEDQKIVRQAAIEAGKYEVGLVRGMASVDSLRQELEPNGVTLTVLTNDEIAKFKVATAGVYEKWAKQVGAEFVKEVEAAVSKLDRPQ